MSLGYTDHDAIVNTLVRDRGAVKNVAHFRGFDLACGSRASFHDFWWSLAYRYPARDGALHCCLPPQWLVWWHWLAGSHAMLVEPYRQIESG